uniref:Uncharacterized protein n=1 Tax=Anguilla anguilla TaxID=7936 RepID=A0A0E9WGU9_ANGAN
MLHCSAFPKFSLHPEFTPLSRSPLEIGVSGEQARLS